MKVSLLVSPQEATVQRQTSNKLQPEQESLSHFSFWCNFPLCFIAIELKQCSQGKKYRVIEKKRNRNEEEIEFHESITSTQIQVLLHLGYKRIRNWGHKLGSTALPGTYECSSGLSHKGMEIPALHYLLLLICYFSYKEERGSMSKNETGVNKNSRLGLWPRRVLPALSKGQNSIPCTILCGSQPH